MSRSLLSTFVFSFSVIGFLVLLLSLVACMLLSTEFLFALFKELPFEELGAGWGSRGESMLPFIRRPLRPKSARSHRNTVLSQRVDMIISQAAA
jgi:hypothetical protein